MTITPRELVAVHGYHVFHLNRRTPAADVFLAYHRPTQAFRDLIVVRRTADADTEAVRRALVADAVAVEEVRHPGIAPVEEAGISINGRVFVAVARPVGRTLREVLAEDGAVRPARRAVELGLTLADALAAAHERGIAHGWVSPDTVVLVTPKGDAPERFVLLGLGAATAQGSVVVPGTVPPDEAPFVSPERALGAPPSFAGDVFSLGAVIQHMLAGATAQLPSAVAAVLRDACTAAPSRRSSSARHFAIALRAALGLAEDRPSGESAAPRADRRPPAVPPATVTSESSPPRAAAPRVVAPQAELPQIAAPAAGRRRRTALAGAGVLGLVASAGAVYVLRHRPPAAGPLASQVVRQAEPDPAAHQVPSGPVPPGPVAAAGGPATPLVTPSVTSPAPPSALLSAPPRVATRPPQPAAATPVPSAPAPAGASVRGASATPAPGATLAASRRPAAAAVASAAGEVVRERAGAAAPSPAPRSPAPTTAVLSDARPAAGTPATVAATPALARPEATEVAGAHAALAEYLGAIGARDLDRLARAYPAMTDQQRRAWAAFFGGVDGFRPQLVVDRLALDGATARARVSGAYEYVNLRPRRAERQPVSFNVTLARDGAAWRVRGVE